MESVRWGVLLRTLEEASARFREAVSPGARWANLRYWHPLTLRHHSALIGDTAPQRSTAWLDSVHVPGSVRAGRRSARAVESGSVEPARISIGVDALQPRARVWWV